MSFSFQLLIFSTTKLLIMSRADMQEFAEYYKWLLRIERAEFEKELLEIVSLCTSYLVTCLPFQFTS